MDNHKSRLYPATLGNICRQNLYVCRILYLRKQKKYTNLYIRKHITHTHIRSYIYVNIAS